MWKNVIGSLKHIGEQTFEKNKNRVHAHITGVWTYRTSPRDWEKTPSVAYDKKDRYAGHQQNTSGGKHNLHIYTHETMPGRQVL